MAGKGVRVRYLGVPSGKGLGRVVRWVDPQASILWLVNSGVYGSGVLTRVFSDFARKGGQIP